MIEMFRKLCFYNVKEKNLIVEIKLAKESYSDIMIKENRIGSYNIYGKLNQHNKKD